MGFLIVSVLLVAPSAFGGPIHQVQQGSLPQAQLLPWGQGNSPGGFIYCAGCGPLNHQQLVFPANFALSKAILPKFEGVNNPVPQQQLGNGEPEPGTRNGWEDGAIPVQQMSLSDDGRYSFSYNTADASRQEERNLDGSVSGSYSYTDPEGKLVQIDYTAGASGYKAYGENVPPSHPVVQLPQPVQDTPEVQEARAKFLETYNRELARIQQDAATATPTSSGEEVAESSTISSSVSEPSSPSIAASSSNADGDTVEVSGEVGSSNDQDDAVVLSGKSESESGEHKSEPQDITALKTALDNNQPIAIPVHSNSQLGGHGVEELNGEDEQGDSDSVVISADDENANEAHDDSSNSNSNPNLPSPSYSITIPVGVGPNAGLAVVQQNGEPLRFIRPDQGAVPPSPVQSNQPSVAVPVQQDSNANAKSNLLPYFYYVSVGGSPHYVTSNSQPGFRSPYPTSLQASLLGAIPLAARHDSQVPNRGGNNNIQTQQYSTAALRPVFLDLENGIQQQQQVQQQNQPSQNSNLIPLQIASLGGNNLNFNNNQLLGQIVQLGSGGAGINYIPAYIVSVGDGGVGLTQQNSASYQGSQNNIPTIVLSNVSQQQQQQQNLPVATTNNQQQQQEPVIAYSKK
ncbi:unnamed protein product [Orchesella dallaii]|uniref:Cuticle protein 6 n=1 Tax=Orchesella dallaii TaxID=48710 RepID=A0ABP1QNC2_9HEXA